VLPSRGGGPIVEITFAESGKMAGLDLNAVVTYQSELRQDGTIYGEGQGVIMASNGEGATFEGQGVGRFTETGGVSFRGAVYYQSASSTLSRYSGVEVAYEHEADEHDNTRSSLWEWK
jgi:hypothetical protein